MAFGEQTISALSTISIIFAFIFVAKLKKMKRLLFFLVFIFSLPQLRADDFKRAQQILDWIQVGQGDSLMARFHPVIRPTLPPSTVKKIWEQLKLQGGELKGQGTWKVERRDTLLLEQCRLIFENGPVRFSLLTDDHHFIVGFHFTPIVGTASVSKNTEQPGVDYVERDTFLINGRVKLPATFCRPVQSDTLYPVVVMVHGIGPMDKDGTLGPNKPFLEVAHRLAAKGVASFRYDKRTFVYGARVMELSGVLTYDTEVVDDAVAALEMAAHLPEVDHSRVYVLGHSLGGMLAPRIAMLSRVPLAGMISVAGSARQLEELLRSQFRYLSRLQGTPESEADSLTRLIYSKMSAPYRTFAAEYNPVGTARGLRMPMLFLQGGHDFQVTATDFNMWKKGLEGCRNARFVWLENCDHLLRETREMAVPKNYMLPGRVSGKAVEAIEKFIKD